MLQKLNLEHKKCEPYEISKKQLLFLRQRYTSKLPQFLHWLNWKSSKSLSFKLVTSLRGHNNLVITQSKPILAECTKY